jgi:hypothetical protein
MRLTDCKKANCKYLGQDYGANGLPFAWMCTYGNDKGTKPAPAWTNLNENCTVVAQKGILRSILHGRA